jgi:hypothetical protein
MALFANLTVLHLRPGFVRRRAKMLDESGHDNRRFMAPEYRGDGGREGWPFEIDKAHPRHGQPRERGWYHRHTRSE